MAVGDIWGGMVAQHYPDLTYPIVMTFLEDSIKVEYPTLGCSGVLRAESYSGSTFRTLRRSQREIVSRESRWC